MAAYTYVDHLQVIKGFCDKSDGKDKLTALIQYLCMFISANEAGKVKNIQTSVTAARKIFRVMRPLETITPLLISPGFNSKDPVAIQAINKIKALLMAAYFFGDHMVWAYQIGLTSDKGTNDRWQKVSLGGWALGSVCTIITEAYGIATTSVKRKEGESEEEYGRRVEEARKAINTRMFTLVHAVVQTVLAGGLMGTISLKPRTLGLLGTVASAMNCYMLLPSYPKLAAPAAKKAQ